ncbi:HotDog domain-containing protein [Kalaharituber pfeilii]|nr:HotDog domain-containing protein [Kalaharituber pfeilii]
MIMRGRIGGLHSSRSFAIPFTRPARYPDVFPVPKAAYNCRVKGHLSISSTPSSYSNSLTTPKLFLYSTFRAFSILHPLHYDGVYRELKSMRHQKPWLQALRERDVSLSAAAAEETGASATGPAAERVEIVESQTAVEKVAKVDTLQPKRMRDSFFKLVLPFTKDEWLVDTYVNATGQLRMGSLFQDLDALAGVISYKHTGPGPTIVTAAVDRISIISPLSDFCDLELSGFVSYVGRSSMEITIEVRKLGELREGEKPLLLTCAFTMVALDPVTNNPIPISPLIVETEEEKRVFKRGEEYKKAKKALAEVALSKQTPNAEESDIIHGLWLQTSQYNGLKDKSPSNIIYMSDTHINSTAIMQPQYRNRYSFMIFGGYLMRSTFELAFCCCSASTRSRPTFISLDPSTFLAPVPVGSVLYLDATVAYTEPGPGGKGTRVQVRVESKVRDVEHGTEKETGVFNYTFWVEREGVEVMPVTYSEFMDYIDARRRAAQQKLVINEMDDGTETRVTE